MRAALLLLSIVPACAPATSPDNAAVERAYAEGQSTVEVTAQGVVTSVLTDSGPSGAHQRFIIRLAGSTQTVLVENNVTIGQRAPILHGNDVLVHGEYVWNDQGGLIHFTHHDPAHTHERSWIELSGVRYQ